MAGTPLHTTALNSPIGTIHIFADDQALHQIVFPNRMAYTPEADPAPKNHALLKVAAGQLTEYFTNKRTDFDLPLAAAGTLFQQTVWQLIGEIEYGRTRTYGEIATLLGNPNKARAVGGAANRNPLPLVIPCHRVLGASGRLTGFAGGLEVKRLLLNLEQQDSDSYRSGETG
jgi:methylated-DNA-[protein]-cysteine S-methyltransferase